MKKNYLKNTLFIGKSLLWSVLLYVSVVAILDWEVVKDWNDQPQVVWVNNAPKALPEKDISNTGRGMARIAYTIIDVINRVSRNL